MSFLPFSFLFCSIRTTHYCFFHFAAVTRDLVQALHHHASTARFGVSLIAVAASGKRTSPSTMCSHLTSVLAAPAQVAGPDAEERGEALTVAKLVGALEQRLRESGWLVSVFYVLLCISVCVCLCVCVWCVCVVCVWCVFVCWYVH